MDLPLKVEVAKLSHVHLLQVLVPFLPGSVISIGLALGNPWVGEQMRMADIGYRTKLFLALVLTYMLGFAFTTVTRNVNDQVLFLIWKSSKAVPWDNPYWRRVVAQYLGTDLLPLIPESTDEVSAEYMAAVSKMPGALNEFFKFRESTRNLDKVLTTLEQNIKNLREKNMEKAKELVDPNADTLAKAAAANREQKKALEVIEQGLGSLSVKMEWRSLHQALLSVFADTEAPFASLSSAVEGLQASGIAAIWVMLQYQQLWNWSAAIFSALVVIVATNALRLVFQFNRSLSETNSLQIASMIRELKRQGDTPPLSKGE